MDKIELMQSLSLSSHIYNICCGGRGNCVLTRRFLRLIVGARTQLRRTRITASLMTKIILTVANLQVLYIHYNGLLQLVQMQWSAICSYISKGY